MSCHPLRISRALLIASLLLCAAPFAPPVGAAGSIWTVNDTGDSGMTTCVANAGAGGATCQLRDALGKAADGDTITFSVTGTIGVSGHGVLAVATNVTIQGPASGPGVTLDGGHAVQVIAVHNGVTASISNLTIANASATSINGAGIGNSGTLTVTNCTFTGNQGSFNLGGGAIGNSGTLTVSSSTFSGNTSANFTSGGGIYNAGSLTVTNSTFSSSSAAYGGAINNQPNGHATMTNDTFSANTAISNGGGIYNFGTLTVANSTFSGNTGPGGFGGGIYDNGGTVTVTNSTLAGNTGGGIVNDNAALNVTNTVVSGNTSGPDLGGNTAPTVNSHNLIGGTALLAPLGSYGGSTQTMSPLPGSPAIDAGDDATCAATGPGNVNGTDQRGIARTAHGAHCDIGAVESQGFVLGVSSGNSQTATVSTAFAAPLIMVVGSAFGEPVAGGQMTFTGPASGAGIQGSPLTATIGAGSVASATPAANGTAGSYSVTASVSGATPLSFSLANAPLLSGISPPSGGTAGGGKVTLTGTGFGATPASVQILVGGTVIPAGSIVNVADTTIVYVAPAHTSGDVPVGVTVAGVAGVGSATYTYGTVTALPPPQPANVIGSPAPGVLPSARPAGNGDGGNPSPLPAPRP